MHTFSDIKELLAVLNREEKLLTEMFKMRKTTDYKYDFALELVDHKEEKIEYLLNRGVIRENENILEIEDLYLSFFEKVLEANEEVNTSYIDEKLQQIKENITYYLNENIHRRKHEYLRAIKNRLRILGTITIRNVVDLKRNMDNTYKNEPNYRNKQAKLENLDKKRGDIHALIIQTRALISDEETTFFKTATDEELGHIIVGLKRELRRAEHNLIEIQRQIITYLNKTQEQGEILEKLRYIKYLKDQFTLESQTDIKTVLATNNAQIFESNPMYPVKLSIPFLQTDDEAFESIKKVADTIKHKTKIAQPIAENISTEYLETQVEEEEQVNLEELRNHFISGSYNLLDFLMNYPFVQEVSFDDCITIYCQLISQYDQDFNITNQYVVKNDMEFVLVYPK